MNVRLLAADSDEELSMLFGLFFRRHGFDVETSSDGLECVDKLRWFQPEVLIVDLNMPWGGGDGVMSLIHEKTDVPSPVVVLITGYERPAMLGARSGVPPAFCFQKPFGMNSLLKRIRNTSIGCRISGAGALLAESLTDPATSGRTRDNDGGRRRRSTWWC